MPKIIKKLFDLKFRRGRSYFIWGPRKTGKSYWLKNIFKPHSKPFFIDLLYTDTFSEYAERPALLRERLLSTPQELVIIDEVQKIPSLLDEVHWLIENTKTSFILTGSSSRKLKRSGANLLAGRALVTEMHPLSFLEVEGFDLERAMHSGMLPPHFLSDDIDADLRSYISLYLKEEIAEEVEVQNLPKFSEFLKVIAITNSELLNYTNVASECGISQSTVRSYFNILEDTFLGFRIPPWTKSKERRMIQTEKFYLFDVGVANFLARRKPLIGSPEFGKSFEHFILMELMTYRAYISPELEIRFWRSASDQEVDFILGDKEIALEIKGKAKITPKDMKILRAIISDGPIKHRIVVSLEKQPRITEDGILILPWEQFLTKLWDNEWGLV